MLLFYKQFVVLNFVKKIAKYNTVFPSTLTGNKLSLQFHELVAVQP
jgi:hypothetical protein